MKTRSKIIILSILVLIVTFVVLLFCGVFSKKYVTEKELTNYIKEHKDSLQIANDYAYNLNPDENGNIYLDLDRVNKQKGIMTQEQYDACIEIFTGKYIDFYYKDFDVGDYDERLGSFSVFNNPPDYYFTITCTPSYIREREYTRIVGDWFLCKTFPHHDVIDYVFEFKVVSCSCLFIIATIITVCVIVKRRKLKEIRAIMAKSKKPD